MRWPHKIDKQINVHQFCGESTRLKAEGILWWRRKLRKPFWFRESLSVLVTSPGSRKIDPDHYTSSSMLPHTHTHCRIIPSLLSNRVLLVNPRFPVLIPQVIIPSCSLLWSSGDVSHPKQSFFGIQMSLQCVFFAATEPVQPAATSLLFKGETEICFLRRWYLCQKPLS